MNKPLALKKTDTIRSAFKLLNGQFGMIVCIMSNDNILTGVVTEGDLRRAILKGFSLAMILGVIFGTYSSIFIANPVLVYLRISQKTILKEDKS